MSAISPGPLPKMMFAIFLPPYGEVTSVKLVSDRETGRARGFGFVEMASEGVQAAVEALDNFSFSGRNLKVNEARPREARPSYSRY